MTTVQRLAAKGVLRADKSVYPHQFWAPLSQQDFTRKAVGQVLDDLLADFAEPALAHLAESADQGDPGAGQLLEELRRRRRGEG